MQINIYLILFSVIPYLIFIFLAAKYDSYCSGKKGKMYFLQAILSISPINLFVEINQYYFKTENFLTFFIPVLMIFILNGLTCITIKIVKSRFLQKNKN